MKVSDFIGKEASYDEYGQIIWGKDNNDKLQMIADVRGWGAIQHLFMNGKGELDEVKATKFQDDLGRWIVEAINEKLARERGNNGNQG